jgi:ribosomal protein L37E
MSTFDLKIPCQRCGEQMEMKDPVPGGPWRPDQFWVCPRCGRHFWSTYAAPPTASPAPTEPAATGS